MCFAGGDASDCWVNGCRHLAVEPLGYTVVRTHLASTSCYYILGTYLLNECKSTSEFLNRQQVELSR